MRMHFDGDTQTFSRIFPQTAPKERRKNAQINFWEGCKEVPDADENPFSADAEEEKE